MVLAFFKPGEEVGSGWGGVVKETCESERVGWVCKMEVGVKDMLVILISVVTRI
jgi:hypothetical protein